MRGIQTDTRDRTWARIASVIIVAGVLGTMMPARAHHRSISGSILVTTVGTAGVGTGDRIARCAWLTSGEDSQGLHGYMIPLRDGEADGNHRFIFTDRAELASFMLVFYDDLGHCTTEADALDWRRGSDRMRGRIPRHASYALVFLTSTVGTWSPCYAFPPLCISPTHVSQPGAGFTLKIKG